MTGFRFADVCVLSPASYNKDFFTYHIPEPLSNTIHPGSLVKVPFGKKVVQGFVTGFSQKSQYQTKDIIAPVRDYPILTEKQLSLASWMSQYFYCSLPLVLRHFHLGTYPKHNTQGSYQTKQHLFLVPSPLTELPEVLTKGIKIPLFSNKLASKEKQALWSTIYSSEQEYIVGTRSALFLPFRNLTEITILEAENTYYCERQAPYFHAVQIALKLAKVFNAKLDVHYSPSFQAELEERKLLGLPPYTQLFSLIPSKVGPKYLKEAVSIVHDLKVQAAKIPNDIEIYPSIKDAKKLEIFIKGPHLHEFLTTIPKGWRVKIYYLNT